MITSAGKLKGNTSSAGATPCLKGLVSSAKKGDAEAFAFLARYYWAPIYRMVYHRVRSRMDAEDITQDVFITAFKRVKSLNEESKFRSWLYTVAINRVRDHMRKRKLLNLMGFSAPKQADDIEQQGISEGPNAFEKVLRKDFWNEVENFLSELSRFEREVFILRFMDQLSISEIAEVMGKGQSTIKTHLYRALKKFRAEPRFRTFLEGIE